MHHHSPDAVVTLSAPVRLVAGTRERFPDAPAQDAAYEGMNWVPDRGNTRLKVGGVNVSVFLDLDDGGDGLRRQYASRNSLKQISSFQGLGAWRGNPEPFFQYDLHFRSVSPGPCNITSSCFWPTRL